MTPIQLPSGNRALWYRETTSTMDVARALAVSGETAIWVAAERQTAGRGTRGRIWHSPTGNLYATWISPFPLPLRFVTQAHICAGCAVHAALAGLAGARGDRFRLKWPNDILIGANKVAGLLIERPQQLDGRFLLGIGVNCAIVPADIEMNAASLADHGISTPPQDVLGALDATLADWLNAAVLETDFERASSYFQEHAAYLGQPITVRDRGGSLIAQGEFCGLDPNGLALVRTADGARRALSAGEIV